jgi:hypothetical protein
MNGGCRRTVVGWWNWRDSTHGSKAATHTPASILSSSRHSRYLALKEIADQRDDLIRFVLHREMAGVEEAQLHVR